MASPLLFALVSLSCLVGVLSSPWDDKNNPATQWNKDMVYNFHDLPLKGELPQTPWSDDYWPSDQAGIAHRWVLGEKTNDSFGYTLYDLSELKSMEYEKIAALSPAEKYDIFNGRYDYPTVKSEWERTSPDVPGWEGLCHGWAPASLEFMQPDNVTLVNPDGIHIPFGSSDVKALLTYYLAEYNTVPTPFLAGRCNVDIDAYPSQENSSACADINAGSYHVLLTNMIGLQKKGFVVDRDRSIQVWNQPVHHFESEVVTTRPPSSGASPKAVKEVQIETRMYYSVETYAKWSSFDPHVNEAHYVYWVELDSNDTIVGGSYESWMRTDFIWMLSEVPPFSGYFKNVALVYKASVKSQAMASKPAVADLPERPVDEKLQAATGTIALKNYAQNERKGWAIVPSGAVKRIVIAVKEFSTERQFDKVRIFEGAHGEGALVAVLHGKVAPRDVVVQGPAAFISFTSDPQYGDEGFVLHYQAQYH